ncbi:hypothetical protein [Glutamicibacter protophormiae]|uniref:hypothetical protein n=1 Tax=Glutamicibacter protophormiae TaxID=37930 RepID=UPI003A8F897E
MDQKRNPDDSARTTQPDRKGKHPEHAEDEQVAQRGQISGNTSTDDGPVEDGERFDAG